MRGGQLFDVFEHRQRRWHVAIDQVFVQRDGVNFAWNAGFQQRFDLGAEDQALPIPIVVEGLFAVAVTRSQQALPFSVPQREDKHTAQVRHAFVTVFLIGMYNHLSVAIRRKLMPARLQALFERLIVINFAIEDDQYALILIENRLMAPRQVDNRETPHAQSRAITCPYALFIRPAMANDLA